MPAVTAGPIDLPRLTTMPADARQRRVGSLTTAPDGFDGEGFPGRLGVVPEHGVRPDRGRS